ncbi:MAG TPA: hypothetical protein VLG28_07895 [Acidimicrobiia bacterium]|nr:hypothetical protein [Acidimicrobiia bacterium]
MTNLVRAGRVRLFAALLAAAMLLTVLAAAPAAAARPSGDRPTVTTLTNDDFTYGTYIIDKPGVYRLGEDISFNPNSPATLTAAVASGEIPYWFAQALQWPMPVDAFNAGFPLFTQFVEGGTSDFAPAGPMTAQYDPSAYGVGFFAAIAISADDVVLDLSGHTIEQSAEHALLQRFFAVIELADQPFVPGQGPAGFGDEIDAAKNVVIRNGTIGLSSHHGIHGNGNENITISNVDFVDYEVGALALNGVQGLTVSNSTAVNRKDVPVLGTFSSAQFIKHYINDLARHSSTTTLDVDGETLGVLDIRDGLIDAINNVHADVVASPNIVDGRAVIDSAVHPDEYALFHNAAGVVDGNSYSYLVNAMGVAVNGFPHAPGADGLPARDITFRNVHVVDQVALINEIPALDAGVSAGHGSAAIDPVGAVFQTQNRHPDTGELITVSSERLDLAEYTGNVVANAQAFVAKAEAAGEFAGSTLDLSRLNITADMLAWVEGASGSETLGRIGATYLCNGDSMFHVNKGVIAFKMDAAEDVRLTNTSVSGLENLGAAGTGLCGDYLNGVSHPAATLNGYGGSTVRAYTFSGTHDAVMRNASIEGLRTAYGSAFGVDVLTDASNIMVVDAVIDDVAAGIAGAWASPTPTKDPKAYGFYFGEDADGVTLVRGCATNMSGLYGATLVDDHTAAGATVVGSCKP